MLTMDVFTQNAFSAVEMTTAVDRIKYVPQLLRTMGVFEFVPNNTTTVIIEERTSGPAVIQTDARGAPPRRKGQEIRNVRNFNTVRLSQASRLMAETLQGIRAFGSTTEVMQLQTEIARRQFRMRRDIELTLENMRLGAVQGLVVDADGTTLFDWASLLGQAIPNELAFDLSNATPASGAIRKLCNQVTRSILRGLDGQGGDAVQIVGLCGDAFFDDLTAHSEVRQTYLNQQEASQLRDGVGKAFDQVRYGNITFINYRSTDDGGATPAVGVPTDNCKFFPVGAGIFQMAHAPAETFDFVNTPGQEIYSMVVPDKDRNMYADIEMYSYPLPVCTTPKALHRARRGA